MRQTSLSYLSIYLSINYIAREDAIKLGKELVRRHFIHHVAYEHDFEDDHLFYRFLGDAKTRALNARLSHHCLPRKGTLSIVYMFVCLFIVSVHLCCLVNSLIVYVFIGWLQSHYQLALDSVVKHVFIGWSKSHDQLA